jgi:hypothetical protein
MTKEYSRRDFLSVTGLGLAGLTLSCGSERPSGSSNGGSKDAGQDLDKIVQESITNSQGVATFQNVDPITVVDAEGKPISNVAVRGYDLSSGDAYLTPGGIAAFPDTEQVENTLRHYLENRTLVVHPNEGVTLFDRDAQDVLFDLTRWNVLNNEYSCEGMYTTEQLIEARRDTVGLIELIGYIRPEAREVTEKVKYVYDLIEDALERYELDLPAGKNWFVLHPVNPLAPPMVIQRGMAQLLFDEQTYDTLNSVCEDRTEGEEFSCTGEELFCDDFSGDEVDLNKWWSNYDPHPPAPINGVLELNVAPGATAILKSHSSYTIGNDTYIFEARWKVSDREGVGFECGLNNVGKGAISFPVRIETGTINYVYGITGQIDGGYTEIKSNEWHTTRFEANKREIKFYIDDVLVGTTNNAIPSDVPLPIFINISSEDERDHSANIDYVKLEKT